MSKFTRNSKTYKPPFRFVSFNNFTDYHGDIVDADGDLVCELSTTRRGITGGRLAEWLTEIETLRFDLGASIIRRAISHCDDMADSADEWYAEWNEEYYMGGFEFLIKHQLQYFEREPREDE